MSKQVGLIRLKGKIGGISFYKLNGVDLARTANGPSKERIASDANFVRTRENNSEFAGSAKAGKALRTANDSKLSKADAGIVPRLTKLFKEINLRSPGARGERSIELSTNRSLLEGFEFHRSVHFTSVFGGAYLIAPSVDRNDATVTFTPFIPMVVLDAPSGATHFRLFAVLGVVSDFVFDPSTSSYLPADAALNGMSTLDESASTALNSVTPVSITLAPALSGSPVMTTDVSAVLTIGVEFFQRINSVDYPLAQGDCMRIVKVF